MKHISAYIPLNTLDEIYKFSVRSHFDYCDSIYHIPPSCNPFDSSITLHPLMEAIERIQYQAALIITGSWKGTSRNKLYEELGWESLSDRRWGRRLIQFFKIHRRLSPPYLFDNLPPKRRLLYGKINPDIYHDLPCKTLRYKNSFFPDAIKSWNNLTMEFHQCHSILIFKSKMNSLIRPTSKTTYGIHTQMGLKYIFQLRVGLSPLRFHKRRHNFLDTPSDLCSCNTSSKTIRHFLFECPNYQSQRRQLLGPISTIYGRHNFDECRINSNVLLYGNKDLTIEENKRILFSTLKCIEATRRFNDM